MFIFATSFKHGFVIGRCISADFEALAALRIIPSCFSMGEGLAKYLNKLKVCVQTRAESNVEKQSQYRIRWEI